MLTALPLLALLAGAAAPAAATPADRAWESLDRAIEQGIRDRVYPGAVVLVGRHDTVLYAKGFGRVSWAPRAARPNPSTTLWDLASLTKVVATMSTAMVLADRGLLDLEAPVHRYLPTFVGDGREGITVRMLLDHTSGLRAWAPFWQISHSRDELVSLLMAEPPSRLPGEGPGYSDLNAMLLGLVIAQVAGEPLDLVATREVFGPLGMTATGFGVPDGLLRRTAPSRVERGRVIAGSVNDENARVLEGVAGHAGLFATGEDLARFAQAWLSYGAAANERWVSEATLRQFLHRSPGAGSRALGWNTRDSGRTMFGTLGSEEVVGHTGYTGTSLLIDPVDDLFVVFLTNRTLGTARRSLDRILDVRAAVADAARRGARLSRRT